VTQIDTNPPQTADARHDHHGQPLAARARHAVGQATGALLGKLRRDDERGRAHWCAEFEGDSILQSEYILMKWILGHEDDPRLPRLVEQLRAQQDESGAWVQYPTSPGEGLGGGTCDVSASVKAYLVLKLYGHDPADPHMASARAKILAAGGAERCNTFTKFYLACLGLIPWTAQVTIPPELVFFPRWFYFHLDKLAAWTRTMVQPLAIVCAHRPARGLPVGIDELYADPRNKSRVIMTNDRPHAFWTGFFAACDRVLKLYDRCPIKPGRRKALERMAQWIDEHHEQSEGMGAIFPPMVYTQVALRCMGYPDDHPLLVRLRSDLDDLMVYADGSRQRDHRQQNTTPPGAGPIRIQPCFSPVWDTGIAAYALADAGLTDEHADIARVRDWLVAHECAHVGDWANNLPKGAPPGGWYFEYANPWYPDVDDTAMVAMALHRLCPGDRPASAAAQDAAKRGIDWALTMQNHDGGWAAFDRGASNRDIYEYVPFADHNAMQDPSCADITGRVLECLAWFGYDLDHPAVKRAVKFVKSNQEPEGCWFGRWGVNYIYGTWQAIGGMRAIGVDMQEAWVQKAGQWLRSVQKPDGSFGETPDTYEERALMGTGPSTPSQTAWAVMTLLTIDGPDDEAVQRGIAWLCDQQLAADDPTTAEPAGSWNEPWFTGTGFPRVFYIRYHLYRHYFPLMCLGRWVASRNDERR